MANTIVLIIVVAVLIVLSVWHLSKNHAQHKAAGKCFIIEPEHGTSTMVKDSNYIIGRIGHFVGEGSKKGLTNIDIEVDLRYTQMSSLYKAIGVLESDKNIKVSEKQKSPSSVILNVAWTELPNTTC